FLRRTRIRAFFFGTLLGLFLSTSLRPAAAHTIEASSTLLVADLNLQLFDVSVHALDLFQLVLSKRTVFFFFFFQDVTDVLNQFCTLCAQFLNFCHAHFTSTPLYFLEIVSMIRRASSRFLIIPCNIATTERIYSWSSSVSRFCCA